MKIVCLSGKGGAGKTLVAVNLAAAAGEAVYIDCDVEEPNGRLFLKPENVTEQIVSVLLPDFDPTGCTGCKRCVDFCRFNALMYIREKPMVFPGICHSRGSLRVVTGILNPGEASGVPIIREALKQAEGLTVIDCPPGSACSVMESVIDADYCVLVAEPTAFGFHNFKMVYKLVTLLDRKCGVIINKQEEPYEPLERFCAEKELTVLARIPYDMKIAALAGDGQVICDKDKRAGRLFTGILEKIGGAA